MAFLANGTDERTNMNEQKKINVIFLFHGDLFALDLCIFGWLRAAKKGSMQERNSIIFATIKLIKPIK